MAREEHGSARLLVAATVRVAGHAQTVHRVVATCQKEFILFYFILSFILF